MQRDHGRPVIVRRSARRIPRPIQRVSRILLAPFRFAWHVVRGLAELLSPVFEVLEAVAKLGCVALPFACLAPAVAKRARRAAGDGSR